jgi:hypothetical protein
MIRRVFQIVPVAALCLVFAGCYAGRYTGGGWLPSAVDVDKKATFGFNINIPEDVESNEDTIPEDARGQVQYNDHAAGVAFHGEIVQGGINERIGAQVCLGLPRGGSCVEFLPDSAYLTGVYWPVPRGQGEPGTFEVWVGEKGKPLGFDDPAEQDFLIVTLTGGTHDGYRNIDYLQGGNTKYHPPKE